MKMNINTRIVETKDLNIIAKKCDDIENQYGAEIVVNVAVGLDSPLPIPFDPK